MVHKKKHITFRLDAGGLIGLGHYFRSITIGHALINQGWKVSLLYKHTPFWETVSDPEIDYVALPDNENDFIIQYCQSHNSVVFYVDGINIELNQELISKLKKDKTKIIFYQNLSNSRHLADIYILPSLHQGEAFFEDFNNKTEVFQGLEYFTFNEKLFHLPEKNLGKLHKVNSIAIISGGSDPNNMLLKVYELLNVELFSSITFNFFYGQNFMHCNAIPKKTNPNIKFLPYKLEEVLKNDLTIAAFGVSAYELMCLNMPVIGIGHQESNAYSLNFLAKETGSIYDLGLLSELDQKKLNDCINNMISTPSILTQLVKNANKIIDRKGVERVTTIINKSYN